MTAIMNYHHHLSVDHIRLLEFIILCSGDYPKELWVYESSEVCRFSWICMFIYVYTYMCRDILFFLFPNSQPIRKCCSMKGHKDAVAGNSQFIGGLQGHTGQGLEP